MVEMNQVTINGGDARKYPYQLIDGLTGTLVCAYKALSIALRDCAKKNAELLPNHRYYVKRPNGSRVTA